MSRLRSSLQSSSLFDETTFYQEFVKDLKLCRSEVIIESPFITTVRMSYLRDILKDIVNKGIKVYIITRDPSDHNEVYKAQSEQEIQHFEEIGVQVLLCIGNHHRKLAILDRTILWEGSLNILSQIHSREFMRRLEGGGFAEDLFNFLNFEKYIDNDCFHFKDFIYAK